MTAKEIIEVLTAYDQHKLLQIQLGDVWQNRGTINFSDLLNSLSFSNEWRIAPEKQKRLLRVDEMGASIWILFPHAYPIWNLVIKTEGDDLLWLSDGSTFKATEAKDIAGYKWSPDRKEIRSFFTGAK